MHRDEHGVEILRAGPLSCHFAGVPPMSFIEATQTG
jgi:hypothetical protein